MINGIQVKPERDLENSLSRVNLSRSPQVMSHHPFRVAPTPGSAKAN